MALVLRGRLHIFPIRFWYFWLGLPPVWLAGWLAGWLVDADDTDKDDDADHGDDDQDEQDKDADQHADDFKTFDLIYFLFCPNSRSPEGRYVTDKCNF